MSGRDFARGLVTASGAARLRANRLRANALGPSLDSERLAYAALFDELADWCDEEAAKHYDDVSDEKPKLLAFDGRKSVT